LSRLSEAEIVEFEEALERLADPAAGNKNVSLARLGVLVNRADTYDLLPGAAAPITFRGDIYQRVWPEAAALRRSGVLLALASQIRCPVVAIHGDYDPHPAAGVRDPLSTALHDFRMIMLGRCGHSPWLERWARDEFFEVLREALS
jgi:pimeloyl-ACP methyl ester carboxylesterase